MNPPQQLLGAPQHFVAQRPSVSGLLFGLEGPLDRRVAPA
jgi:hypothetical protein